MTIVAVKVLSRRRTARPLALFAIGERKQFHHQTVSPSNVLHVRSTALCKTGLAKHCAY